MVPLAKYVGEFETMRITSVALVSSTHVVKVDMVGADGSTVRINADGAEGVCVGAGLEFFDGHFQLGG